MPVCAFITSVYNGDCDNPYINNIALIITKLMSLNRIANYCVE